MVVNWRGLLESFVCLLVSLCAVCWKHSGVQCELWSFWASWSVCFQLQHVVCRCCAFSNTKACRRNTWCEPGHRVLAAFANTRSPCRRCARTHVFIHFTGLKLIKVINGWGGNTDWEPVMNQLGRRQWNTHYSITEHGPQWTLWDHRGRGWPQHTWKLIWRKKWTQQVSRRATGRFTAECREGSPLGVTRHQK